MSEQEIKEREYIEQEYNEQAIIEPEHDEQAIIDQEYNEQEIRERRALRIQQMKKEKQRAIMIQNCIKIAVPIMIVVTVIVFIISKVGHGSADHDGNEVQEPDQNQEESIIFETQEELPEFLNGNQQGDSADQETTAPSEIVEDNQTQPLYSAAATEDTLYLGEDFVSKHALFIDLASGDILAKKDAYTQISPASMTKVLTVLVAAEHITEEQLDDTFTMTLEITDYGYVNDCSSAGFLDGEVITVRDLFFGTILPSGADAAVGLAVYVAGSQEAFVEMMNDKLEELGLADTAHMTNCVGLYDAEHYCTVYDMAMIMEAAIENDLCKEVMTAHTYTTSATEQHPDGIIISNWFLRRIEDKDTGGEVICAKTGFVAQSGSCAVSYGIDHGGKEYVCVTANSTSSWRCIYDHVDLYKMFATGGE